MILYFSGSGNNKLLAERLSTLLEDDLVSLNDVLKEKRPRVFESAKPFVLVSPIYAWRYPQAIEDLVRKGDFRGSRDIYFIATMGLDFGRADRHLQRIALKKKMAYKGFEGILMPSNYVVSEKAPTREEALPIIEKALKSLEGIAQCIQEGKDFPPARKERFGGLRSSFLNYGFNRFFKTSRNFRVDSACIRCGTCVNVCPTNNVRMVDGKIAFADRCMFCLSCVNHCPTNAITYDGKKNGTYLCPDLDEITNVKKI